MVTSFVQKKVVTISPTAKTKIDFLIDEYRRESGLHGYISLFVSKRGCSGMAYDMKFILKPEDKDFTDDDCRLSVQADSILWLLGTHIDYQDSELESGFKFVNPQQKKSCHCGEAFYA